MDVDKYSGFVKGPSVSKFVAGTGPSSFRKSDEGITKVPFTFKSQANVSKTPPLKPKELDIYSLADVGGAVKELEAAAKENPKG